MKKLLIYITTIASLLVLTPNVAEARHSIPRTVTYVSGHTSCGCPIYTRKVFRYYDYYGHPVYAYYRVPVVHHCRSQYNNGYYYHRHGYRHHTPRYYPGYCHTGYRSYSHYRRIPRRSRVHVSFRF